MVAVNSLPQDSDATEEQDVPTEVTTETASSQLTEIQVRSPTQPAPADDATVGPLPPLSPHTPLGPLSAHTPLGPPPVFRGGSSSDPLAQSTCSVTTTASSGRLGDKDSLAVTGASITKSQEGQGLTSFRCTERLPLEPILAWHRIPSWMGA